MTPNEHDLYTILVATFELYETFDSFYENSDNIYEESGYSAQGFAACAVAFNFIGSIFT